MCECTVKIPCVFWTSCCRHRPNDGGAACPCASSPSARGLLPPVPPQSAGHIWNFGDSYGNPKKAEKVAGKIAEIVAWTPQQRL